MFTRRSVKVDGRSCVRLARPKDYGFERGLRRPSSDSFVFMVSPMIGLNKHAKSRKGQYWLAQISDFKTFLIYLLASVGDFLAGVHARRGNGGL